MSLEVKSTKLFNLILTMQSIIICKVFDIKREISILNLCAI